MSWFPHPIPVVYVDELEVGRNTFRSHFQDNFELFTCSDASLALQVLQNRPGCVLVALQRMSKASGIELISEVQLKFPSSPCILLHTEADIGVIEKSAQSAGIYRALRTPYSPMVLRACMERAYEISWNNLQMSAMRHELDVYRRERDLLSYKLETEFFEPIGHLAAICSTVVHSLDTAPAHELADFLGRRLSMIGSGRERFRDLYRGSRVELLVENLNAEEMLHELKSSVCQVYGLDHGQIRIEIKGDGVWVGDCEKIKLILVQLLNNAACSSDSSDEPLKIALLASIQPDFVKLEVADNGRGIALPQQQRVFRMFESSPSGSGSGMGLFILRETVRQLGGDVRLESEVGIGSVFQIRIPNLVSRQH